jgi:hypothetical protein
MDFDGTNLVVPLRKWKDDESFDAVVTPIDLLNIIDFMKDKGLYLSETKKQFIQRQGDAIGHPY